MNKAGVASGEIKSADKKEKLQGEFFESSTGNILQNKGEKKR